MPDFSPVVIELAVAAIAGYGAARCNQLQRYGTDPRLRALSWFFGLFATSMVFAALWSLQLIAYASGDGPRFDRPQGRERVTAMLVLQHLVMLASLIVAVRAFGRPRLPRTNESQPPTVWLWPLALAPLVVWPLAQLRSAIGTAVPLVLAAETGLTLYIAIRATLNHLERRTRGALQVAAGFGLFFLGQFLVFVLRVPGAARGMLGDILLLIGIVLLVQILPRPR